jgi:general secretion pathway protein H
MEPFLDGGLQEGGKTGSFFVFGKTSPKKKNLPVFPSSCENPKARSGSRGLTLIELLITVALVAIVTTGAVMGSGALVNARMRGATTMISGAIRLAFTRASATSRPNRLVFDIETSKVLLEETSDLVLVRKDDATGGGAASTQAEKDALEQATRIVKGPQAPRARFAPVKALGFDDPDTSGGRSLGKGVRFRKIETGHSPDGQTAGRVYLYFWPGGQTERASIQLGPEASQRSDDGMSILVSALTGRVRTVGGAKSMEPLRDDGTSSEREEQSY